MVKQKGKTSVPMVLGIIGGVIGAPFTLVGLAFANFAAEQVGTDVYVYLFLGIIGSLLGLVFGILSKKIPRVSGILLLVAAVLVAIPLLGWCLLNIPVVILFSIGGIVTLAQKKTAAE